MDQGLIPRRYAKALYRAAVEKGCQQQLYASMQLLGGAFAAEPKLGETMRNPFVSDADKAQLILAAAGDTQAPLLADFVKLLVQNGRIGMVRDIAAAYCLIYRKESNIYRVEVVSAAAMDPAQEQRLKQLILSHLRGGSMEYASRIDPSLIGGFVVNIDNERLDASVKNELKQLRLKLLSNK